MRPVEREGKYVLEVGDTYFEVDPIVGGRITCFATGGENVLMPLDDLGSWTNGGSTFWTSPQSAWGWPPPEAIDRLPYQAKIEDRSVVLISPDAMVGAARLRLEKRFQADPANEAIAVEYTVTNLGDEATLAGWEISRVAATGLTFYAGAAPAALGTSNLPRTEESQGAVWMDHAAQTAEAKLGADGDSGFVAYASDSLLFVKTFEDVSAGEVADGEAEIELYVKPGEYVEVEQQSRARTLQMGERLTYALKWYLRRMDPAVEVAVGSDALLSFAKEVARVP